MTGQISKLLRGTCLGVMLLVGCDDDPARELPRFDHAEPLALEQALLFVNTPSADAAQALLVDLTPKEPRVTAHPLPPGEATSYVRPGYAGEQVVVLTEGRNPQVRGGRGHDAVNSHVVLFDRKGEQLRVELPGRFEQLTLSDDGRFAVAHEPSGGIAAGNTVAVVDLDDPSAPARTLRFTDATSRPATSFQFSGFEESARRWLVASGVDSFHVVDLEQLERAPIRVPLKLPGDARRLVPRRMVFQDDQIFVQVDGSSDVLVLSLTPNEKSLTGYDEALLQLTASGLVRDIALITKDGALQLVAVTDSALSLLDPITGRSISTPLGGAFGSIVPFEGRSPFDSAVRPRGLLISEQSPQLGFVDFDDGTPWAQQVIEVVELPDSVERVIPLAERRLAVLLYRSSDLAVVDLEQRLVSPISTQTRVAQALLDSSEQGAVLWLNLDDGRIGRVDLLRLEATEILLNAPAADLLSVPGKAPRIAVVHASAAGHVTLLDPEAPSRESARELVSFLYTRLLD